MNLHHFLTHLLYVAAFIASLALSISFSASTQAGEMMQNGQELESQLMLKAHPTQYDLNLATVKELASIKGIGLKKAQAIVTYREANGDFESLEQIKNVKGLGNKLLQKLTPFLVVNSQ